jgi:hypothetical protein
MISSRSVSLATYPAAPAGIALCTRLASVYAVSTTTATEESLWRKRASDAERDPCGAAVASGVGQQFPRQGDEQLVVRAGGPRVDLDLDFGGHTLRHAADEGAQRRLEPRVVEHVRVQLGDLAAQLPEHLGDRGARPPERLVPSRAPVVQELLVRDGEGLHRLVVEDLGEAAARRGGRPAARRGAR